ncbi:MAG: hypothetical protein WBB32_16995 [Flavobacteriales bacterium]
MALPPSKSVANRALILAALAGDLECVTGFGTADDTRILHQLLLERPEEMHCGDGGTTFRFLLAWACVQEGKEHLITGNQRLLERPHAPLVNALRELGADITIEATGLRVRGRKMRGGHIRIHSPESSQFISALLLVAPCFTNGLDLQWTGLRLSEPYARMTLDLLRKFGAQAMDNGDALHVASGALKARDIHVPPDWSAAAFWFEVAALEPEAQLVLKGLSCSGMQGDEALLSLFLPYTYYALLDEVVMLRGRSGADLAFYHADLLDTPDLFQPLAFALAGLGRKAAFTGLHNLSLKETDRLKAVSEALNVLGSAAEYEDGAFKLQGEITNITPPPFDPQGDHRMAMSLAPLALVCDAITILHPDVVNKSYPGFWEQLKHAGFSVEFS